MTRALLIVLAFTAVQARAAVDFVKDVQPIFKEHCYKCHGPERQEVGLRFDHKGSALKGSENGPAIRPGDGNGSVLVYAIRHTNPKLKMPKKAPQLSPTQIETIVTWIDEGATWPDSASANIEKNVNHWAFKAPVKPPVPTVASFGFQVSSWNASKNPIDAFIAQGLKNAALKPAPRANAETIVRRLYLDLVGLPPTPKQVDDFVVADKHDSASSIEHLATSLLQSPHYGERWARHWLDAAHYADSNGYEKDPMRFIWFYRDWVINAFNRDLPYNQFIIEQLAGDQLPNATQDQIVATGFLRNTMINEEGGVDPEQFRMEAMFDRMDVIGKSILGLSINCCQCHNHKYDPISQEEYYRMFAFLNNDNEPWRVVYTPEQQAKIKELRGRISDVEARLQKQSPDWKQRMEQWVSATKAKQPKWQTLKFVDDPSGGEKALRQPDGSILAQGYAPTKSDVKFEVKLDAPVTVSAFRLELMNDPNLPAYGPGRSQKGTAALTEFTASMKIEGKATPLKFIKATADFGELENTPLAPFARDQDATKDKRVTGPISYAIDGKADTAWGIDAGPGRRNVPRNAVFVLEKPVTIAPDAEFTVTLSMKHGGWNSDDLQTMNLGRYRISVTDAANAEADPVYGVKSPFDVYRSTVAEWKDANAEIEALWKEHPEGTTSLVLHSREEPRLTAMLKRGDFTKPGDKVHPGVPAVLNPLPKNADGSRLTFANWIANRQSPTTARTLVNRVWQSYFGTGLVGTPEDLGTQSEAPSNPALLDWLACEFMDRGWSMKELHRLIVTSQTYQQSSVITPAMLEQDPYNRLLARGPRFRVEGEVVRDLQLAISGLLDPTVGGRPVMPPAPTFLFEKPASYAPFPWHVDQDSQQYRRAVYVFRRRSTPYPFLSTFDVPNGEAACVRRSRSNTPLQALMTLNETLSMEAAEALGKRMTKEGGADDAKRIAYGFKLCTGREASSTEIHTLTSLLQRQQQRHASNADHADGYTVVARVLLNLDETITKE